MSTAPAPKLSPVGHLPLSWWLGPSTDLLPQGNMRHLTGLEVETLDGSFLPFCIPHLSHGVWGFQEIEMRIGKIP